MDPNEYGLAGDDFNERAIPTIPGARQAEPTENWTADAARRAPRQRQADDDN